jgi:hypothetical protein
MNLERGEEKVGKALISELVELSIRGLEEMFDEERLLFCNRLVKVGGKLIKEGVSLRYSIITLLGLYRLRENGIRTPFPLEALLEKIVEQVARSGAMGDLGLLVWLCAMTEPDRIMSLRSSIDIEAMLERHREAVEGKTTEISWLLAGLSNAVLADDRKKGMLEAEAARAYRILLRNSGHRGIFGHQGKSNLTGMLRGRIGTFSDQIYPIYALCRYAKAFSNDGAARSALDCAKTICELQGPLGQWWWYYNSQRASVAGRYPVYSVHQDGMAPMALFELQATTGIDFSHHIDRGLLWITGINELRTSMISAEKHVIWRCIHRGTYRREMDLIAASLGVPLPRSSPKLAVLLECRPYHLGWLLYAYADQCFL